MQVKGIIMKTLKLFLLLVFTASLLGCYGNITSSLPDPGEVIDAELGDTLTFSVSVDHNSKAYEVVWRATGREIEWTSGPDEYRLEIGQEEDYNLIEVRCILHIRVLTYGWDVGVMRWHWRWEEVDSLIWTVRTNQQPPVWNGTYIIKDATDIEELKKYTEITGDLIIEDTNLSNLSAQENIINIGGDLIIQNNDALTSLNGLVKITSVGENVIVWENDVLENLEGLNGLQSIGGSLKIHSNDALMNLDGLNNVTSVSGSLNIYSNNTLTSLGLDSIASVESNFYIINNPGLPTDLAEDLRDQVEIGGIDRICGNLDGDPCE